MKFPFAAEVEVVRVKLGNAVREKTSTTPMLPMFITNFNNVRVLLKVTHLTVVF